MSSIIIFFFLFFSCFLPSISVATNSELAAQVCNRTIDSKFCLKTFNSDPSYQPSAPADRVSLAYIIFSKAYIFGNDTKTNIDSNITNIGSGRAPEILSGLKNCQSCYTNAVRAVYRVLENLESETYCYFDALSAAAQSNATACGKGLRRNQLMPLAQDNDKFINIAGICYAVAMLFPYNC